MTKFFRGRDIGKYVKGIGVQWTGMQTLPTIHKEFPKMPVMQTVLVVYNPEDSDVQRTVAVGDKSLTLTLKAKSINTVVI